MTAAQAEARALRKRIAGATCDEHGFGRTHWGHQVREQHIELVARSVELCKALAAAHKEG